MQCRAGQMGALPPTYAAPHSRADCKAQLSLQRGRMRASERWAGDRLGWGVGGWGVGPARAEERMRQGVARPQLQLEDARRCRARGGQRRDAAQRLQCCSSILHKPLGESARPDLMIGGGLRLMHCSNRQAPGAPAARGHGGGSEQALAQVVACISVLGGLPQGTLHGVCTSVPVCAHAMRNHAHSCHQAIKSPRYGNVMQHNRARTESAARSNAKR